MALEISPPGPFGLPGKGTGKSPGPLGFRSIIFMAPGAIKAVKTLMMPSPTKGESSINAHDFAWDLFGRTAPALDDLHQGSIANCPLASLLGALANTPKGREYLKRLVIEHAAVVETNLAGVAASLVEAPKGNAIVSNRYFTVTLDGKSIEVSAVLYTDDADRNWTPTYMKSPNEHLWPGVIEKAYAVKEGSYDNLDDPKLTANVIWKAVMGTTPGGYDVTATTPDAKIKDTATHAGATPAIAASKDDATDVAAWHGFTVLGMDGNKIKLFDPLDARQITLSLDAFRKNFKAVLSGDPP